MSASEKNTPASSYKGEIMAVYLYRLVRTCLKRNYFLLKTGRWHSGKIHHGFTHFALSVISHLLIIALILLLQHDFSDYGNSSGGFIQISSEGASSGGNKTLPKLPAEKIEPENSQDENKDDKNSDNNNSNENPPGTNSEGGSANSGVRGFSDGPIDTTSLNQVYKEPTRNVTIKYPPGWTYIDQNVKNKLDGVTFWFSAGNINPPPYIHLEVKEKYLFNEKSFKYNSKEGSYTFYYNDPAEMAGQVSQIIYVRTDTDADYSIKLIISGWDAFKVFQPTFYGIIKTFKFGKSFF